MQTIAEWESEKKAKARRQKELKDEVHFVLLCSEDLSERTNLFSFINLADRSDLS